MYQIMSPSALLVLPPRTLKPPELLVLPPRTLKKEHAVPAEHTWVTGEFWERRQRTLNPPELLVFPPRTLRTLNPPEFLVLPPRTLKKEHAMPAEHTWMTHELWEWRPGSVRRER